MSQFMLAVYSTDEPREPMTDEEMQRGFAVVQEIEEEMRTANALVYSGRLLEPARARVVRPRRRMGNTTDGPFIETKEALAGVYILEARDLDHAIALASRTPVANGGVEVRPLLDFQVLE